MRRLPSRGPDFMIDGAWKYTSGTMSATCAAWSHQARASPSVYGAAGSRRNGLAPRAASPWRKVSTFARYCVFVCVQGVVVAGPLSSFRPMKGVWHPVDATALSNSLPTAAGIVDGSAGLVEEPTSDPSLFSQ